jgi:hypothetical protein
MNLAHKLTLYMIGIAIIILAGCASPTPFKSPTAAPSTFSPIPAPKTISSPIAALPAAPAGKVVRFQIDRPLKAGATTVTGRGLAGIPISIDNLTLGGNELGAGIVGNDNRFSIKVPPLADNVRIGVAIGDVSSTGHSLEEFDADAYKGDEPLMVPMIGFYLDTALAQP